MIQNITLALADDILFDDDINIYPVYLSVESSYGEIVLIG